MNKSLFLLVIFLQLLVSCNKNDMENKNEVVTDQNVANMLKSSPEEIAIAGKKLCIETYLWRDFMPEVEPDGKPLMACIKFVGESGDVLSKTISLSKVYVVNNDVIWTCDTFEINIFENDVLEVVIRGGPTWEPDTYVDVICEFAYLKRSYKLMAKMQKINATY